MNDTPSAGDNVMVHSFPTSLIPAKNESFSHSLFKDSITIHFLFKKTLFTMKSEKKTQYIYFFVYFSIRNLSGDLKIGIKTFELLIVKRLSKKKIHFPLLYQEYYPALSYLYE